MRRIFLLVLTLILLVSSMSGMSCVATDETSEATNLTSYEKLTLSNGQATSNLKDSMSSTKVTISSETKLTVTSEKTFTQVYIIWNKIPGEYVYSVNGTDLSGGTHGFLHEYFGVEATTSIEISLAKGMQLCDIYLFTEGTLPDWVQVWEDPCEEADVLLFTTHSDDEQLFFAGLLPYYAVVREAAVQVVYMTNHWDTDARPHEQLNGLWTVGIRNYPIISEFPDDARSLGSKSETKEVVLERAKGVYNEDEWIQFQVEMLRRFKAQVVVDHDFAGEYRHGAHILNADALTKALLLTNDATYDPESATKYGTWEVKKAYFHLYEENAIVMDYDTPSDKLGGKTPFEVSQEGFMCHTSQHWTWFKPWVMNVTKAADIATYNPTKFGLYYTTVGADVAKNDMLENITLWAEIHAQEEAKRLAEEKAKQEAEQKAKEEAERKAAEEAKKAKTKKILITTGVICVVVGVAFVLVGVSLKKKKQLNRKETHYRGKRGKP